MYSLMSVVLQVIIAIRAARNPSHLPEFMARLDLVQSSAKGLAGTIRTAMWNTSRLEADLTTIRQIFEPRDIVNVVPDGTIPFQIDASQGPPGVALEFRCIYCEMDRYDS